MRGRRGYYDRFIFHFSFYFFPSSNLQRGVSPHFLIASAVVTAIPEKSFSPSQGDDDDDDADDEKEFVVEFPFLSGSVVDDTIALPPNSQPVSR